MMGKVGGDADLSPRGLQYANCLADYVNGTLNESDDLTLWTSCLRRTIQTAQGIHTRQERLAELNELDSGVCEGMTYGSPSNLPPVTTTNSNIAILAASPMRIS